MNAYESKNASEVIVALRRELQKLESEAIPVDPKLLEIDQLSQQNAKLLIEIEKTKKMWLTRSHEVTLDTDTNPVFQVRAVFEKYASDIADAEETKKPNSDKPDKKAGTL